MSPESRVTGRPLYVLPAFSLVALSLGLALLWPGPLLARLALVLFTAPFALDMLQKGGRLLPLYMLLVSVLTFLTPPVPYMYPPLWAEELAPVLLWLSLSLLLTLRLLARSEKQASLRPSATHGERSDRAMGGLRPSRRLGRFPEPTRNPVYWVLSRHFGEAFASEYDRAALARYLSDVSLRSPGFKADLSRGAAGLDQLYAGRARIVYELALATAVVLLTTTAPLWLISVQFPWLRVPAFEVTQPEIVALLLAMLAGLSIAAKWLTRRVGQQKRP